VIAQQATLFASDPIESRVVDRGVAPARGHELIPMPDYDPLAAAGH